MIPTSAPVIGQLETQFVSEAVMSSHVSGLSGGNVPLFEQEFADYCGAEHGVATTSGTTALHLALIGLDLQPGDEVLVATLTNMATFFAVLYCGATPIPIDVESDTCNLDPSLLEDALTDRVVGVIVVHLFGHPVDMDPVVDFCAANDLWLVEDAAEAHGAKYKGRTVGTFGDAGCFSFFANKIITTGEGGMILLRDAAVAARARNIRNLAFGDSNRFMHKGLGFNYRLTNVQAALGLAQMRRIDENIALKRQVAARYSEGLRGVDGLRLPVERPDCESVFWMYHVVLQDQWEGRRDYVRAALLDRGIETRECFVPFDQQDYFVEHGHVKRGLCPVAGSIGMNGFYIPSGPVLSPSDQDKVVDVLRTVLGA